jgi:hypothetical protein
MRIRISSHGAHKRTLPGNAAAKPHPRGVLHAKTHGYGRGPFSARVIEVFAAAHVDGSLIHPGALVRRPGADHQHCHRQGNQYS